MNKDLITISDLTRDDIKQLLELAVEVKKDIRAYKYELSDKVLGLVFQKPSARTRVSFQVGMIQLGGQAAYLNPDDIKLGVREEVRDVARVLSRYLDGLVARTFSHKDVIDLAQNADIPVINGLSDLFHPCQAISDLLTIKEKRGDFKGLTLAYVGDGNNVLHSLLLAGGLAGLNIRAAAPEGYEPDANILAKAKEFADMSGSDIIISKNPVEAVKDVDIVYTDVWASMGQEDEYEQRKKIFKDYQVNTKLIKNASKDVLVMHCLPAHRGDEITDEVIESKNSIVFDQAENRMHAQKAILLKLLK